METVSGGGGSEAACPPAPPLSSEGRWLEDPPTLTGGLSDQIVNLGNPYDFGVHWLKLTIFAGLEEVQSFVEGTIGEGMGLGSSWVEKGPVDRWEHVLWAGLESDGKGGKLVLRSPKKSQVTYTIVEIPGEGCELAGLPELLRFLRAVNAQGWRWHGKRVDNKWDRVPFQPQDVDRALRAGLFTSRSLNVGDVHWEVDAVGAATSYLGLRKSGKNKLLRVYNQRGFPRCENELHNEDADDCLRAFIVFGVEDWSRLALGYLTRTVDFRDTTQSQRVARCPRLDWWEGFVEQADRVTKLVHVERPDPPAITPLGRSEMRIQRAAKTLWPIIEALGGEYLVERLQHYAREKVGEAERSFARDLEQWKGFTEAHHHAPLPF